MHLSDTELQSLALLASSCEATVSMDDGSILPQAGHSLERIDPNQPDAVAGNWAVSEVPGGTPGACNSVTPGDACDASSGPATP